MDLINIGLLKNPMNWLFFGLAMGILLLIGHTFFQSTINNIEGK